MQLFETYVREGNMMKWREQFNGDCSKRDGRVHDRCDLRMPGPAEGALGPRQS